MISVRMRSYAREFTGKTLRIYETANKLRFVRRRKSEKKQEKREGRKITEMKKIKVFFSLLLTLAFALSFTACAGDLSGFNLGAFVLSD